MKCSYVGGERIIKNRSNKKYMWSIAKILASSLSLSDSLSAIAITIAIAFSVIALSLTTHCSSLIAHSSQPNVVLASNQLYCLFLLL